MLFRLLYFKANTNMTRDGLKPYGLTVEINPFANTSEESNYASQLTEDSVLMMGGV